MQRPHFRLVKRPRDAELAAAEWLRWLGFENAVVTPLGPDGGIDVRGSGVAAQVKMEGKVTSEPVLHRLAGAARAYDFEHLAFFSLAGFTPPAMSFADSTGMALFEFDYQSYPIPKNKVAQSWLSAAEAREETEQSQLDQRAQDSAPNQHRTNNSQGDANRWEAAHLPTSTDDSPSDFWPTAEDLPFSYARAPFTRGTLGQAFQSLRWPFNDHDTPPTWLKVAYSWSPLSNPWPQDVTEWPFVRQTDEKAILQALKFFHGLEPRPRLEFGGGVPGVGWAWVVLEMPAPAYLDLFAVELAPLKGADAERTKPDLNAHGMDLPVHGLCGSLETALHLTRSYRELSERERGHVFAISMRPEFATHIRLNSGSLERLPLRVPSDEGRNRAAPVGVRKGRCTPMRSDGGP